MAPPQGLAAALGIEQDRRRPDPEGDDTFIDIANDPESIESEGTLIEPADDGGVVVDFEPSRNLANIDPEMDFDANLAAVLDDGELAEISQHILEGIEADRQSRVEWDGLRAEGIKLLGLNIEERSYPFQGACGTYDPLMAEAVFRIQAIARGELLPARGPVKTQVVGLSTDPRQDIAIRKQEWMNLFLTQLAPEYYPDFDQMLLWWAMDGSAFKLVYQDPVLKRPVLPFINADNFIVDYNATSLETARRATYVTPMSKRQLREMQKSGAWLDIKVPEPQQQARQQSPVKEQVDQSTGLKPVLALGDDTYRINNCHTDLELEGLDDFGLPVPYRVTIDEDSRKVLGLYRNWRQDDPMRRKRRCFVHYKFLAGFGFYGYGYSHVLAGAAKTTTMVTRQIVDGGTLNNFPGGVRVKGMRLEDNNLQIGPMSFPEIETAGLPIQQAIMAMPYKEPSEVSFKMLQSVRENARNLANTAEIAVGEGRQDAPVGTTIALLEASQKVQSAILKRAHAAQREEYTMLADLFGEHLPERPYPFPIQGGRMAIMRSDFQDNNDIIPVADPNITSATQRVMRTEQVLKMATGAGPLFDQRAAYMNMLREMGYDEQEISRLMPAPPMARPLDPLSENQNMILNKPVKAAPYQDHDAHMQSHMPLTMQPGPAQQPALAHIAEHTSMKMRVQVEQIIGMPLPPPDQPLPPQIENQIAVLVAKAMQVIAQQQGGADPSATQIMMEQLKLDAAKIQQQAAAATTKSQTEIYKANLKAQTDMAQIRSDENVARMKAFAAVADNMRPPPAFATELLR
jgi:hypothetical protein